MNAYSIEVNNGKTIGEFSVFPETKIHRFKALKRYGPSGDNGFDQTTKTSSIYGTCAHSASEDRK